MRASRAPRRTSRLRGRARRGGATPKPCRRGRAGSWSALVGGRHWRRRDRRARAWADGRAPGPSPAPSRRGPRARTATSRRATTAASSSARRWSSPASTSGRPRRRCATSSTRPSRRVPALANAALTDAWSGLRPFTRDELPLLGAGDARSGSPSRPATFATGSCSRRSPAEIVAALVTGHAPPVDLAPFSPARLARPARGLQETHHPR